jgi:hypothetical protein
LLGSAQQATGGVYPGQCGLLGALHALRAFTPWNAPLYQTVAKVAPALLAGCTVVLKPSVATPLTAVLFAEVTAAAGIPAGVVNVVYGAGPVIGGAISGHPGIDMVSFTGSTGAGKRVSIGAVGTVKRVALELDGKSANVILDDADLQNAVDLGIEYAWMNGGQICAAWIRSAGTSRAATAGSWAGSGWRSSSRSRPFTARKVPGGKAHVRAVLPPTSLLSGGPSQRDTRIGSAPSSPTPGADRCGCRSAVLASAERGGQDNDRLHRRSGVPGKAAPTMELPPRPSVRNDIRTP